MDQVPDFYAMLLSLPFFIWGAIAAIDSPQPIFFKNIFSCLGSGIILFAFHATTLALISWFLALCLTLWMFITRLNK